MSSILEMENWVYTFFDELNQCLEIKKNPHSIDWSMPLVKGLQVLSTELSLCKNIHKHYQIFDLGVFNRYIDRFEGNTHVDNKKDWKQVYSEYENFYRDKKFGYHFAMHSIPKSRNISDEMKNLINEKHFDEIIWTLNDAYPALLEKLKEFDKLINEYNSELKNQDNFIKSNHKKMKELIETILNDADHAMVQMITLFTTTMDILR